MASSRRIAQDCHLGDTLSPGLEIRVESSTRDTCRLSVRSMAGSHPAACRIGDRPEHGQRSDLEAIPGIGPKLARKIIDMRDQCGRFGTIDELLDVNGIGTETAGATAPFLDVRGTRPLPR